MARAELWHRLLFRGSLTAAVLLVACGAGGSAAYDLQRSADGTLSGVVVTLRILDRKEAIGAFAPATLILRDQGFLRWISLNSTLRQIVVRDSTVVAGEPDLTGDTFVLNVNQNGTRDYSCDLRYTRRAPIVVANFKQSQDN